MSKQSLRNKTINGIGWSAIEQVTRQTITFVVGLVLARLLSPDEYGLIGLITVFITFFNVFVVSGFGEALIRKKDATYKDYNTVFVFNIVVSGALFVLLFFLAPYIASFFDRPELVSLTRVMGVILIINALAMVQNTILTKQIDFKKQTKISFAASITSGIIGIGMALCGFGVWSLVGQQISRQVVNVSLLWIWSSWHPSLDFSASNFKELWNFGWKLLVVGIIDNTWKEIYQLVIGKCYNPSSLGFYSRAYHFANLFSQNLTNVVQRVSYPVLSSIQDDKNRLREGYRHIIRTTMFVTFICMLGMAAIAKPMVVVLIGEKWIPCVVMLQILCLNMTLYPLHAINLNILKVVGRSDIFLKLEIIKKIIAIIPICFGVFWSIYAMLIGSVVVGFVSYFLNAWFSGPFISYGVWNQIRDIMPSFSIALLMVIPVYCLSLFNINYYLMLISQMGLGIFIVVAVSELLKNNEYQEIKGIALKVVKKKR